MRTDELYLSDILESGNKIQTFIDDVSEATFYADPMVQDAVLMNLIIIGEAANRVSEEIRKAVSDIPWKDIAGFRHVAVHGYFSLDLEQIWRIASEDVPELLVLVEAYCKKNYPD